MKITIISLRRSRKSLKSLQTSVKITIISLRRSRKSLKYKESLLYHSNIYTSISLRIFLKFTCLNIQTPISLKNLYILISLRIFIKFIKYHYQRSVKLTMISLRRSRKSPKSLQTSVKITKISLRRSRISQKHKESLLLHSNIYIHITSHVFKVHLLKYSKK